MGNAKKNAGALVAQVLKGLTVSGGGSVCHTCRDYPDVATTSREVLELWIAEGERTGSLNSLYRSVKGVFPGYPYGMSAFYNHVRHCCEAEYTAAMALPVKLTTADNS